MNVKDNIYRPVIAIYKTCTLTFRSHLESYKRLVLVSSRNFNVSLPSCLGWWSQRLGLIVVSGDERLGLELLCLMPIPADKLYVITSGHATKDGGHTIVSTIPKNPIEF